MSAVGTGDHVVLTLPHLVGAILAKPPTLFEPVLDHGRRLSEDHCSHEFSLPLLSFRLVRGDSKVHTRRPVGTTSSPWHL
jgi:hypothetical protein